MPTLYQDLTMAAELDSRTWLAVQAWAKEGLDASKTALLMRGASDRDSDFYRGQASIFGHLLAIPGKRAVKPDE